MSAWASVDAFHLANQLQSLTDTDRSMDVDMEQPEESGAKEQPKDGSGIPQRARSAKSRIKKEAPQHGRSAAFSSALEPFGSNPNSQG